MPMTKKKELDVYTDGYLYVCDSVNTQTSFGAKVNELKKSDLKNLRKLAFVEMSLSQAGSGNSGTQILRKDNRGVQHAGGVPLL